VKHSHTGKKKRGNSLLFFIRFYEIAKKGISSGPSRGKTGASPTRGAIVSQGVKGKLWQGKGGTLMMEGDGGTWFSNRSKGMKR